MPRLDKRWIQTRVEEELNQAVQYAEGHDLPHWTLDQHGHRHELTKIIHEAAEDVPAKKIKPIKPYVSDGIMEISAHTEQGLSRQCQEKKSMQTS